MWDITHLELGQSIRRAATCPALGHCYPLRSMPLGFSRKSAGFVVGGGFFLAFLGCGQLLGIESGHARAPDGSVGSEDPTLDGGDPTADLPPIGEPDASCGDTTKDEKNCGECGRDCRGGKCERGRCTPVVFAYNLAAPSNLVVTDEGVYWAEESSTSGIVRRCDLDGCPSNTPRTLFERKGASYYQLSVSNDLVYAVYLSDQPEAMVETCNRLGCAGLPAQNFPNASAVLPTPTTTYYIPPTTRGVWSATPPDWKTTAQVYADGHEIAVLNRDLYILLNPYDQNPTLYRCVDGDCTAPIPLASHLVVPAILAAGAKGILWQEMESQAVGNLFVCETTTCAGGPRILAKLDGAPNNYAFDDEYVYWTDGNNTVKRVPWSGSNASPEILLPNQGAPGPIAMRDGALYFTRVEYGDIVRYVPPP
jgi:hypothetical protein